MRLHVFLAQVSVDETQKLVDTIANKNDRWLFVALLVVFLLAIGWLARWGMRQLELRDAQITALGKELGEVRKEYAAFAIATTKDLSSVLARNTDVLDRIERTMTNSHHGSHQ